MPEAMEKVISFVMAPEGSRYEDQVLRRVTTNLAGITVTLSETTTGMDFEEFTEKNPSTPVDGRSAMSLVNDVSRMSDEQLAAMGLVRVEGTERAGPMTREEEVYENSFDFPVHEGFGVYLFSDGTRKKFTKADGGKVSAEAHQDSMNEA